jgi:predicted nucleic acid-binding protein
MFLLDTPIVFELRKAKAGQTDPGLTAWAASVPRQHLYISAITLLELETGVAQMERRDKLASAGLRAWLDGQVSQAFEGRILPVDAAVARRRAGLHYADARDALLAATALEHGLTLVTREEQAFRSGRVKLFNPWGYKVESVEDDGDWRDAAKTGPPWLKNLFIRS